MKYPRKVYAIRHNATNKVYVGSSCNVDRRFLQHLSALRSHKHIVLDMQKDFDEYGEDFTLTTLDTIDNPSEDYKEYEWMDKYQSFVRGSGYNYQDGKRKAQGKQAADDGEKLIEYQDLSDNERELLDIIRGSVDPKETFFYMVAVCYCFAHPEIAERCRQSSRVTQTSPAT